jgi:hypothetical protein
MRSEQATYRFELVQNKYREGGSRERMRKLLMNNNQFPGGRDLSQIRTRHSTRSYGWPFAWLYQSTYTFLDYQEAPETDALTDDAPQPIVNISTETRSTWRWDQIIATVFLFWWAAWLFRKVTRKRVPNRSLRLRMLCGFTLICVATALIAGLNRTPGFASPTSSSFVMEEIPSSTQGDRFSDTTLSSTSTNAAELHRHAQDITDRYKDIERPNALVGLIIEDDVISDNHLMQVGYWGTSLFQYTRLTQYRETPDAQTTPVPRVRVPGRRLFVIESSGATFRLAPSSDPGSLYVVSLSFARILLWITGAWISYHLLRQLTRPLYQRVQKKRAKRGLCIWCKYPISSNQ